MQQQRDRSNVDLSNADVFLASFNPRYGDTHPFGEE